MRYFDGEMWTNHFHEPGKLPEIGNWLSTTVSSIGQYWQGAVALTLFTTLIANVAIWVALRAILSDVAVVDEQLVNFDSGLAVAAGLVLVFAFLWQGIGWVATSRFMHRAHFHAEPTVSDALLHAARRLPRYLGAMLLLVAGFLVVFVVVAILSAVAAVLGALAVLGLLIVMVWALVKLAFVVVAVAVAPPGVSPFRVSAAVSANRFWPVLGRLLMVVAGIWIASAIITTVLGQYGQVLDAEQMTNIFRVEGETFVVSDFRIADLLPSTGQLAFALIINSIIQGAGSLVTASAFVRLYLDSGAPSEL